MDTLRERGVPPRAKVFGLRDGSKHPATLHGHRSAVPQDEYVPLGQNVGIALDGLLIAIDIDRDCVESAALAERLDATGTWKQRTAKRGYHWLYYSPAGFTAKNGKLRDNLGVFFADTKTKGYVVAPGSEVDGSRYEWVHRVDPLPAPQWVLELVHGASGAPETSRESREGIPYGDHDNFLVRVAGYLRGQEGLSESAIAQVLQKGPLQALEGTDPSRPYTETDMRRIARSAASWTAKREDTGSVLVPSSWATVEDLSRIGESDQTWIVDDYIPQGALCVLYGPGGVGKSTFVAWVAAQCTSRGKAFGFVGAGEESPEIFAAKVAASGGDVALLRVYRGNPIKLPRDTADLQAAVGMMDLSALYFDAYRSHMQSGEGRHEADRTRDALQPLAEVAQATSCTVLCTTHNRKADDEILGSVEIENVSRVVLRAYEPLSHPGWVAVRVKKSNLLKPEGAILARLDSIDLKDPLTGAVQMQVRTDGTRMPVQVGHLTEVEVNALLPDEFEGVEQVDAAEDAHEGRRSRHKRV